jgi:hypothetical protein
MDKIPEGEEKPTSLYLKSTHGCNRKEVEEREKGCWI